MKFRMIALFVSAVSSVSAFAGEFDTAVKNRDNFRAAEAKSVAAFNDVASRDGSGRFNADGSTFSASTISNNQRAIANRIAAENAVNGTHYRNQVTAQQTNQINKQFGQSYIDAKNNQSATAPVVNATSYRLGITQQQQKTMGVALINKVSLDNAHSINVAAASLPANTPVTATIHGVSQTTTAGAIAALNPAEQIAVPHVAAFQRTAVKGGASGKSGHSTTTGHDGHGQENAHSHAFGGHGYGADNSRSEGFGGHSHFH